MKRLILLLALLSGIAHAEDKVWGHIVTVEGGMQIHGKYGSYQRVENIGTLVVRFNSKENIRFNIASISDKTCENGIGEVVYFDMNFRVVSRMDYVKNGGNGTAVIGDLLCLLASKSKGTNL